MKANKIILLFGAILAVSACGDIKKDLGIARNSPDEFTVVKQAPLTLPPEFNLVPPVESGRVAAVRVEDGSTKEQARRVILGSTSPEGEISKSSEVLLGKIGVDASQNDVRKLIDEDNGYIYVENKSVIQRLVSGRDQKALEDADATTVDAVKEAERIKENLENNKPLNEGDVPVIKKRTSPLGSIF